ncbi:hypothetical protein OCE55_05040 [Bacillus paranthracis]|uniref:Uncharacterized protein n=1 Tax=uncultured Caudovirales phage TaxID=2100421 RepID=A0A2H4J8H4_9CAUD|nr:MULTISPECIES: hypothetical protein [Bacillus cereus group]ASN69617.1 hypothetical protein 9AX2_31 [uncultured Caudovirales phage]MCU5387401.1 hypothetical protein [Bacillus paranthracis]MDA1824592.1 hypothetical protein [Bacillus cereus group sp. BY25LC]MDA2192047.1 hypothetical protein [Bacillus cereus group sp. Bc238]MDA2197612.1 hypothetical protein [Bacillus cereus group sp. Bc237]
MKHTILDNPPSEETALKMVEFFMKTLVPRALEEERRAREGKLKKEGELIEER